MANKMNFIKNRDIYHSYRSVLVILVLCGYDYNFYKENFYLKIAVKFYCVALIIIVTYAAFACCPRDISQVWSLLEYVSSVVVILFSKSQTELFFNKLRGIDAYLRIKIRHYHVTKFRLIVFCLITWLIRVAYTILYCFTYPCYDVLILYAIRTYYLLALDLNRVWRCILFDAIRYRLKILRIRLEESPENDYYLYVQNCKSIKENKLRFCLHMYRCIADLVDLVSPELHALLFLSVVGSLPKLIANVYHIFTAVEGREPLESLGYVIMHLIQICLLLFSPFVVVEYYSVEVGKMQLYLVHRLMEHNSTDTKEDLENFLRYTQFRTFKYRIFRMIPINLFVPLELINLCISYVIVLINFTHLY